MHTIVYSDHVVSTLGELLLYIDTRYNNKFVLPFLDFYRQTYPIYYDIPGKLGVFTLSSAL